MNFMELVSAHQEKTGCTRTEALKATVREFPKEYQAFLDGRAPAGSARSQQRSQGSFEEKVRQLRQAGLSATEALTRTVERFPELHERYLLRVNGGRRLEVPVQ